MINIPDLLYEICEDKNVYNPDFDLIESEVLDSYAFIEFFSKLEDNGIIIQPTRIDRSLLRTPGTIEQLVKEQIEKGQF